MKSHTQPATTSPLKYGASMDQYSIAKRIERRGDRQLIDGFLFEDSHNGLSESDLHSSVERIGGGLNKAHRVIRTRSVTADIESRFMAQASAFSRAENQRNERRAKR